MYLYHYYDKARLPFLNISELTPEKANCVLERIRQNEPLSQCAKRHNEYIKARLYYEGVMRGEFEKWAELSNVLRRIIWWSGSANGFRVGMRTARLFKEALIKSSTHLACIFFA